MRIPGSGAAAGEESALKRIYIRRSELEHLIGCESWRSESSDAASFGTFVHLCIAEYWNLCAALGEDQPESVDQVVEDLFTAGNHGVPASRHAEVLDIMRRFAMSRSISTSTFVGSEVKLEALIDPMFGVQPVLTGTLDRLDLTGDTIVITDYKTRWNAPDASWQMMFYNVLAAWNYLDAKRFISRLEPVRAGLAQIKEWDLSRSSVLAWWRDEIRPLVPRALEAKLGLTEKRRTPGRVCFFCADKLQCAEAIRDVKAVPADDDSATETAARVVRLEQAAKEQRDALKEYLRERDGIVAAGREWGFIETAAGRRFTSKETG